MKIIVNCCGLTSAGGIQVALSFIKECINFPENDYHIFISKLIAQQIIESDYPIRFHFYIIKFSSSSIINPFSAIRKLKKLEDKIKPNCVFTVFGPSYWTPKTPHLIGYAIPHYVYPEYYKKADFSLINRYLFFLKKYFHIYFFKRNADFYYTETFDVAKRLSQLLNISENKIFTVGNTYSHVFSEPIINYNLLPSREKREFRLISISAYYPHKNLKIINNIIPYLKKSDLKFVFILTLPGKIFNSEFDQYKDNIINLGPVPLNHCPYLYANSDALFLPTFLECFSASYPEAMKMRKPILTSDLSFAHDICGDAAEYFDPLNPEDIANKIVSLATNKKRQEELIKKGDTQLENFETPFSRARKLLNACEEIYRK